MPKKSYSRDGPSPKEPHPSDDQPPIRARLFGTYGLPSRLTADLDKLDGTPFNADYSDYAEGRWESLALFNRDGDANSSASHEYEGPGQWTAHAVELPALRAVAIDLFNFDLARSARVFVAQKGLIRQHRDYLEFEKGFRRLHLVLRTCTGAFNGEGTAAFHMAEGQVWFVDGTVPHWAVNTDDIPRYHLAVDFPADTAFDDCVRMDRLAPSSIEWQSRRKVDDEVVDLAKLAAGHASAGDIKSLLGALDKLYTRYDFDGLNSYDVAMLGCGGNPAAAREVARRRNTFLGV